MSPTTKLVLVVVGAIICMVVPLVLLRLMCAKAEEKKKARKRKLDPMPENMGPASREEIEAYAAYVLEALGLEGLDMRWTTGGSVWIRPHVYIDESYIGRVRWIVKEMVLHEIAHIGTWPADDRHGRVFYNRYGALLTRFMCQERARSIPEQPTPELRELIPERPIPTPSTTITSSWERKRKHGN